MAEKEVDSRLTRQVNFIREIDGLKRILRQTLLADGSRRENSAEHSWHLAVMAAVLYEHADEDVDLNKVIKMLLVHDIVEIDAGDTFLYDPRRQHDDRRAAEEKAARRIFRLLPSDQAENFIALWREFEDRETPEARFAAAMDRLQPVLHNVFTDGITWREHGVTSGQVLQRNEPIGDGSTSLWAYARKVIDEMMERGHLDE